MSGMCGQQQQQQRWRRRSNHAPRHARGKARREETCGNPAVAVSYTGVHTYEALNCSDHVPSEGRPEKGVYAYEVYISGRPQKLSNACSREVAYEVYVGTEMSGSTAWEDHSGVKSEPATSVSALTTTAAAEVTLPGREGVPGDDDMHQLRELMSLAGKNSMSMVNSTTQQQQQQSGGVARKRIQDSVHEFIYWICLRSLMNKGRRVQLNWDRERMLP